MKVKKLLMGRIINQMTNKELVMKTNPTEKMNEHLVKLNAPQ
jgi:hypothetical protein